MRIISGIARGRKLWAPTGMDTRPTADRVKEALFSIIESRMQVKGIEVLDLYAGSGALGLEAISRGASLAVFVDRSNYCHEVMQANARQLGFREACTFMRIEASKSLDLLAGRGASFDLILADPPYADDAQLLLMSVAQRGLVKPAGLLIIEHGRRSDPGDSSGELVRTGQKRYGDTMLSLYAHQGQEPEV